MPIAPQVPGVPTTVTPDASPPIYTSSQGPAPDGYVVADDVLAVHQMVLNVQNRILPSVPGAVNQALIPVDLTGAIPHDIGGGDIWVLHAGGADGTQAPYWSQDDLIVGTSTQALYIPVSNALPYGGYLTAATVNISPANNHIAIPEVLPRLRIIATPIANATIRSEIADNTDSPLSVAAYNLPHQFGALIEFPVQLPATNLYRFWLVLTHEGGANAISGLVVNSAWLWVERDLT